MASPPIVFNDGAAYEQMMGKWSHLVGREFLDWVAPSKGLTWVDVGCGNGAFTELIAERCAPAQIDGVDPSEGQLDYARKRHTAGVATFHQAGAEALPFADRRFDAAVMALVIFFVPEPAKGVAEMARVTKPGGLIASYAWDILGGGFPTEPIRAEMRALGHPALNPPSVDAAELANLKALWSDAGIGDVATRQFTVQRTYPSFEDYWTASIGGSTSTKPIIEAMSPAEVATLKGNVRGRLVDVGGGQVAYSARANAIKGRRV